MVKNKLFNKSSFIVYIYLIIGIIFTLFNYKLNNYYIFFILFFLFKWIFNYRKCTLIKIECLIRKIKKEQSILYNLLKNITDLRNEPHIFVYSILIFYLLYIHYIVNKNKILII
jgi:hypothetical protein